MVSILDLKSRDRVWVNGSDLLPVRQGGCNLNVQSITIDSQGLYTVTFYGAISKPLSPHHSFDQPKDTLENFSQVRASKPARVGGLCIE